jgi:hypothetical protein
VLARVTLGVAFALAAGALALDLSGHAARMAGSNHVPIVGTGVTVPGGHVVCQVSLAPPADSARVVLLVGTTLPRIPPLRLRFVSDSGALVYTAQAGGEPGTIGSLEMPVQWRSAPATGKLCVRVGGSAPLYMTGVLLPPASTTAAVDGHPQGGAMTVLYLRRGRESWWHLLPTLSRRFGYGKASWIGTWTLPVAAFALLCVWIACGRLVVRLWR